jgi:transcriptional regulator with XRE-family HTH domain
MAVRRTTKKVGRLIRDARMSTGLTQKDLAKRLGVRSGSYVGMLESGLCKGVGVGRLREIAHHLDVRGIETYRWMAAAGHLPPTLRTALMKHPERWDEVTELLVQWPRSRRRLRA